MVSCLGASFTLLPLANDPIYLDALLDNDLKQRYSSKCDVDCDDEHEFLPSPFGDAKSNDYLAYSSPQASAAVNYSGYCRLAFLAALNNLLLPNVCCT